MSACPVCGGADARALFSRPPEHDPSGREFSFLRCASCGTERLDPLPTADELAAAYGSDYYDERAPTTGVAGALRRVAWRSEMAPLARVLRPGMRVLEIGCGTGELLAWLRDRHGIDPAGIDLSTAAVEAARARGIDAHEGLLSDGVVKPESVDAVVMRHVLEHVPSPRDLLAEVRTVLRPGGAVLCTIPITGGWDQRAFGPDWEGYEIPEHLTLFPPAVARQVFQDAGLRPVSERYTMIPNPWVNGSRARLRQKGRDGAARAISLKNPVALALGVPFGVAAGAARKSGRLTILARRA